MSTSPTTQREVAPGVYRFGTTRVNWYVVDADDGLTVIDAGLPDHWDQLIQGIDALGHDRSDIDVLLLTHAHADHIGFAERLRETGVEVWLHERDLELARNAGGGPPRGFLLNLWRPAMLRLFVEMVRAGVTSVQPISAGQLFDDGDVLDVPGRPRVIHIPGHTGGSCAFHLEDRNALFCGDALATMDLLTGRRGEPRLLSAVNADDDIARVSLDSLAELDEIVLLPGHGDPWRGTAEEAVRLAKGQ